jgi:KaiC/GvpD/RAD55 family RecA-like ATPase
MESGSSAQSHSPGTVRTEARSRRFKSGLPWFDALVPEGLPVPSSILLSGTSGTGKPFVGLALAASWLRQGGRVIFAPMHLAFRALFQEGLRDLLDADLRDFEGSHFFVLFDSELDAREPVVRSAGNGAIRANLVNPRAWREALAVASAALEGGGPTLVYASALNLLLFSPTFGPQMFQTLLETIRETGNWTYLLAMSSSILLKRAAVLEQAADHLFVMERVPRQRHVQLRAARVRDAVSVGEAVPVPVQPEFLEDLKNEAVASRRTLIPAVSRI